MKTLSILILLSFIVSSADATNYYFSSSAGNDNRSTSEAQNINTPWKTISKLNSIFSSLNPGDSVLLKRGDVFNDAIVISRSGTSNAHIVLGAYGSGSKPIVVA